jgi:hypothetical protein
MLKTIRVKYIICGEESVLIDVPCVLLWNNEGLYKLFPYAMLAPTGREQRFLEARWSDGYQIPAETARLLTGE